MIALLLTTIVSAAIPHWVEQAFMGRPGSKWTAVVAMDRPGPGDERDTGRACRDGTSERLDFHHGSHFMAGDSAVFLESVTHIAWVGPRRGFPAPPDSRFQIVRTENFLGRPVVVTEVQGPHGHGRRLWIDTLLPLVMKSESIQKDPESGGPPERQFLSIQVGVPCPASDFQIPQGWTINHGHPPRPPRPDGRPDRKQRRHEVESPQALAAAVGFAHPSPPWLPAGFSARSWAWIETRQGKAAQVLFGDGGSTTVSVFFRPGGQESPPYCPSTGCKDREGRAVYFGKIGTYAIAATGDLTSEQMERVVGNKK